jgi:hypothetical protein
MNMFVGTQALIDAIYTREYNNARKTLKSRFICTFDAAQNINSSSPLELETFFLFEKRGRCEGAEEGAWMQSAHPSGATGCDVN